MTARSAAVRARRLRVGRLLGGPGGAAAVALALVLAACSRPAPAVVGPRGPDEPVPGPPVERGPVSPEYRTAIQAYLLEQQAAQGVAGEDVVPPSIYGAKSMTVGGQSWVIFSILGGDRDRWGFARLYRGAVGWRVGDLRLVDAWSQPPDPGTGGDSLEDSLTPRHRVVLGFVDPTLTRVMTVDPAVVPVDSDRPDSGAVILLSDPWGQVRVYRGSEVIAAWPLSTGLTLPPQRPLDAGARAVGDGFLFAILNGQEAAAATYVLPLARPELLLPPLADLLLRIGPAVIRVDPLPGHRLGYRLRRPGGGTAMLSVLMASGVEGWKVVSYAYAAGAGSRA